MDLVTVTLFNRQERKIGEAQLSSVEYQPKYLVWRGRVFRQSAVWGQARRYYEERAIGLTDEAVK